MRKKSLRGTLVAVLLLTGSVVMWAGAAAAQEVTQAEKERAQTRETAERAARGERFTPPRPPAPGCHPRHIQPGW